MELNLVEACKMLAQFSQMDGYVVHLTDRAAVLELCTSDRELMLWVFNFGLVEVSMGVEGPAGPVAIQHKYVASIDEAAKWAQAALANYLQLSNPVHGVGESDNSNNKNFQ
ncbi:MAG: hypothetical protein ABL949_12365 [Fimbriimonadaceae bacterium]